MKRPNVPAGGGAEQLASIARGKTLKLFPRVDEVVCDGTWDDGEAKGDRALMLFVSSTGSVRALLKVGRPALKLASSGRSIDEALAALDALLSLGDTPWEADTPQEQRRRGRK